MNDTDNSLFMDAVSTADGGDTWQLMEGTGVPQRNYKDTVFRLLFNDREKLLSLFNAVNGTSYHKPEELEIITLQNAVYLSMKNDLSFLIDFRMYLYEHQSTFSPNLPLRDLFYVARVRKHTRERPLNEGVELAVSECIREGILRDFLLQNRAEVISMSIFEYDQEAHMKLLKKESYADGWTDGKEEGREEGAALNLISLVQNWIKRGLKEKEIVSLTEEPPEKILRLIQIIKENPEMSSEQIRKIW